MLYLIAVQVPLETESVDMCVFCLSLMGTNVAEYLREANRILKKKSTCLHYQFEFSMFTFPCCTVLVAH